MSNEDVAAPADAAIAVVNALQPLNSEERSRVLRSAAALFGITLGQPVGIGPAAESPPKAPLGGATGTKKLSIVELLQDRGAATNSQRIACFAYYREKVEGSEHFSKQDLAAYFPQAKLAAPGPNYSRDYNGAVREGWVHDDGAQSYLTQKGEAAVEAGFGGKAKPRGATASKKSRKRLAK